MPELDAADRDRLRKDQFAYVDRDGGEHLPINDESHVRNAMARFNQTEFESKAAKERARKKILAAAKRHGIPIVINTDAHAPDELALLRYGILQGRRAGLTKADVANTRTPAGVMVRGKWLPRAELDRMLAGVEESVK